MEELKIELPPSEFRPATTLRIYDGPAGVRIVDASTKCFPERRVACVAEPESENPLLRFDGFTGARLVAEVAQIVIERRHVPPAAKLCDECGQPMLPPGVTKRPNEYDHARGCPRAAKGAKA